MGISPEADDERHMVEVLRERVSGGDYSVDPRAVAEAMLARRLERGMMWALCSEMLIAVQPTLGSPAERESLAGDDAS